LASLVDNLPKAIEGLLEDANPCGRDAVGTPTGVRIESLDEYSLLEARHCLVQGSRPEANAREAFDVLHERVAMFLTGSQAGEDEEGHATNGVVVCLSYRLRRSHVARILRSA
jgi:hypothetical protein